MEPVPLGDRMPKRRGFGALERTMSRPRLPDGLRLTAALALVAVVALIAAAAGVTLRSLPGDLPQPLPAGEPLLVFAEFGVNADRVYVAPATDLDRRTLIETVAHAAGWAITAAPEMAGSLVAYTVLPPGGPGRRDAPAELWLLDVETRESTRLASDADLLVAPRFDASGAWLAYRSTSIDGEQRLVRVELATRLRRVMHSYSDGFGVFPVGFDAGGALLFAQLSSTGTDLYRLRDGAEPERLLHASDDIARDWRVSPDGRSIAFVAPERSGERVVHRLHVVALDGGSRLDTAVAWGLWSSSARRGRRRATP